MSRIGKLPIMIPDSVKIRLEGRKITVTGPKGILEKQLPREIEAKIEDNEVVVVSKSKSKQARALHGTFRMLLSNMIHGVSEGWGKTLELVGTGYRATLEGDTLVLTVGYSHPVKIKALEGISFTVEKTKITIEGVDKELVGETSARIRRVRPPEPYKGKGIKYEDEIVRRKPGKAAKAAGAAAQT